MENFIVEFFEKEDGTFPAEEFILSQELKMRAKIFRMLELLELNGNANPSVKTLSRIATALGKEIRLSFEPIREKMLYLL